MVGWKPGGCGVGGIWTVGNRPKQMPLSRKPIYIYIYNVLKFNSGHFVRILLGLSSRKNKLFQNVKKSRKNFTVMASIKNRWLFSHIFLTTFIYLFWCALSRFLWTVHSSLAVKLKRSWIRKLLRTMHELTSSWSSSAFQNSLVRIHENWQDCLCLFYLHLSVGYFKCLNYVLFFFQFSFSTFLFLVLFI